MRDLLLLMAAKELKNTTKDLGDAIEPITAQYNDLAYKVERRSADLNTQSNNLARTAEQIQKKNADLVAAARQVGSLVVGLQNQVGGLQQTMKSLPATLNPPPLAKKQKKSQ